MKTETMATPAATDDLQSRREAFGDALRRAMSAADLSQGDVAGRIGVRQTTVSEWIQANKEPRYEIVFSLEQALDLPPGALSHHLGYVPVDAVTRFETAVQTAPGLSATDRETLYRVYAGLAGREASSGLRPEGRQAG
jgi:transcriptional regulator with XRE-family HTH domain